MPKISSYEVVAPASNDLVTVTDASDSNNTKNVTVGSLSATVYSGAYKEIYDNTSGEITTIASANTFVLLSATTVAGSTNDATLTSNNAGRITNTGTSRTFVVNYCVSAVAGNNQNLMFRIHVSGSPVLYSESDTITSSGGKATSTSNAAIITLNTGQYVEVYVANSAVNNVTLEHLNLILRQV